MTEQEVQPYVGKAVRATLADGRIVAGTLHMDAGHGHGHTHYALVSGPIRAGEKNGQEMFHGAQAFVQIDDAAGDPAAQE